MKSIDLELEDYQLAPAEIKKNEPRYPTFHYEGKEELGIPESGTMTIRYQEARSSKSKDKDGDKRYVCDIEVQEILDVEGEKDIRPAKSDTSAGDALDKLMAEKESAAEDAGEEGEE